MGGSGGGFFPRRTDPEKLKERLRKAEEQTGNDRFEAEVAELLGRELARYNDRDAEGIQAILDKVKAELRNEVEGTVDLLFGGSVAKHTYVDGLSDVDALVLLSGTDVEGKTPDEIRSAFAERLSTRFGRDNVSEGQLAVTITQEEKVVQLLPAVREGTGFKIAGAGGSRWSRIDPQRFADALTRENRRLSGKLVSTIKLAKSVMSSLPEPRQLKGYHTEAIALRAFRSYEGPMTTKCMLPHFFEEAAGMAGQPIRDSTRQSRFVDEYLGPKGSVSRRIVADALGRIARKIKNADGAHSVESWKELLGES